MTDPQGAEQPEDDHQVVALDVQDLFELPDADFNVYVGRAVFEDPYGAVWAGLLHQRVIKRTKGAAGFHLNNTERLIQTKRALVAAHEWTERGFRVWYERNRCAERIASWRAFSALITDVRRRLHADHQSANGATGHKITGGAWARLGKLAAAVHWHRHDMLAANLTPTDIDRKLWRQMLTPVTVDGAETTLDDLFGTGKYGKVDWPDDFVPWAYADDDPTDDTRPASP